MVALEEWSDGSFRSFSDFIAISDEVQARAEDAAKLTRRFKDKRPKAWAQFCLSVHRIAAANRVDTISSSRKLQYLALSLPEYDFDSEPQSE